MNAPSSTITTPPVSTPSLLSSPSADRNIPSSVSHMLPKSRFWSNKVAVGGTFAAIGLVLIGVVFLIAFTCVKRRRRMKQPEKGNGQQTSSIHVEDPEDWRYTSRLDPFAAPWNVKLKPPPCSSSSVTMGERSYSDKSISKLIA
ncbi:hypothetical protein AGABI1DRAFT_125858 [Agaricus bisporus var. burnettii JB137-S8]|uniref:Mid2 domain-containing protein n=1 Tax=Agaricus bisporus var. burnettii (strain JB137-S8 / ATCC MYA-4627 / FGSC 10392) TaxID=597362 RepID=K5XDQ9_AGABU|nr:uncharacterized protein AGABI1DRAFT_125858 [Agaricus bisporus var. burnettii JB137-S8]EKM81473.1 hypothetical protein AGABI1DRAFT_125858 [Agaricus bisporus var. burnettii JB137-S8]